MTAHARLSPSAADRWAVCPGSVRLIERLVADGVVDPNASSAAADEGTAAHHFRELALTMGMDAWAFVGCTHTVNGVAYLCDDEMAGHLQRGLDWINEQPGDVIVEHKVDLGRWLPGQFGTLDTAIIDREARRLTVFDLKYGAGIDVDVEGNRQLRIYALGILDNFDLWDAIDDILIVIDQPRCGGFKTWPITIADMRAFGPEIQAAGEAVDAPDAPLVVSEKGCTFCEVKNSPDGCPAYTGFLISLLGEDTFDDLDAEPTLPDPDYITPERRWHIVKHANLVTKWLAKLHDDCLDAAQAGKPDPGSKAVAGKRGNRRYVDPDRAEAILIGALGDDAFTRKLKSPAEAEKDLAPKRGKPGHPTAWAALTDLVTQDEGRPILVPDTDARPALTTTADAIDDLEDFD